MAKIKILCNGNQVAIVELHPLESQNGPCCLCEDQKTLDGPAFALTMVGGITGKLFFCQLHKMALSTGQWGFITEATFPRINNIHFTIGDIRFDINLKIINSPLAAIRSFDQNIAEIERQKALHEAEQILKEGKKDEQK
jgi:hypothetical protein